MLTEKKNYAHSVLSQSREHQIIKNCWKTHLVYLEKS